MLKDDRSNKETLDRLREIWEEEPELRLGQLIVNAVPEEDIYFISNESLIKELENMYLTKKNFRIQVDTADINLKIETTQKSE